MSIKIGKNGSLDRQTSRALKEYIELTHDSNIGEVKMYAGSVPPACWEFCEGQTLLIAEYPVLFEKIGASFGGDGEANFKLPDLRGRVAVHPDGDITNASSGGSKSVTLTTDHIPAHSHSVKASSALGNISTPEGSLLGGTGAFDSEYQSEGLGLVNMDDRMIASTGGGQSFDIMPPYLAIKYMICVR